LLIIITLPPNRIFPLRTPVVVTPEIFKAGHGYAIRLAAHRLHHILSKHRLDGDGQDE
jgi:hypothetical protein